MNRKKIRFDQERNSVSRIHYNGSIKYFFNGYIGRCGLVFFSLCKFNGILT